MIIYLHGFRSGPQSWKSRSLKARMDALGLGEAFWCEQLPVAAPEAIALVEAQIAETRRIVPRGEQARRIAGRHADRRDAAAAQREAAQRQQSGHVSAPAGS